MHRHHPAATTRRAVDYSAAAATWPERLLINASKHKQQITGNKFHFNFFGATRSQLYKPTTYYMDKYVYLYM